MVVSSAALAHPGYFSQTFLEAAPACQIRAPVPPVHPRRMRCPNGRGVLLCGTPGRQNIARRYLRVHAPAGSTSPTTPAICRTTSPAAR